MRKMQAINLIKKIIFLLITISAVLLIFFSVERKWFSLKQEIVEKIPVNRTAVLYITEGGVNATTASSYRYYLFAADKSEAVILEEINKGANYFLLTDNKARVHVEQATLFISVTGRVYQFNNSGAYPLADHYGHVNIFFSASP